jgi:hypothetical protein
MAGQSEKKKRRTNCNCMFPATKVDFTIVRYGTMRTIPVTLARDPYAVYKLKMMESPNATQTGIRRDMFGLP